MNWQSLAGICALVCLGPWIGLLLMGFSAWAAFEVVIRVGDWRAGRRIQRETSRREMAKALLARRTCDGSRYFGEKQAEAGRVERCNCGLALTLPTDDLCWRCAGALRNPDETARARDRNDEARRWKIDQVLRECGMADQPAVDW